MTDSNNNDDDSNRKTVYLIRHAESEENRRVASLGTVLSTASRFRVPRSRDLWASLHLLNVPAQVDSPVSEAGRAQIEDVARQLERRRNAGLFPKRRDGDGLVVLHSPLQRACDTCEGLLRCRAPDIIARPSSARQHDDDGGGGIRRVESLDLLREKTPAEWLPGNAASLRRRLEAFEDYLATLPADESVVCVVGHSQYFKNLLNLSYKFGNCDVYKVEFVPSKRQEAANASQNLEKDVLPPQWSGLERIVECTFKANEPTDNTENDNTDK